MTELLHIAKNAMVQPPDSTFTPSPPPPCLQALICVFSAFSGYETRVRPPTAGPAAPTAEPSPRVAAASPAVNQRAAANRRAPPPGVAWGKSYLVLSIIAVLAGPAAAVAGQDRHAARIAVWDCQQPTSTAVYDGLEFCGTPTSGAASRRSHEVLLAQAVTRHRADGFKCEATRTTRSHICGAFSYEKALPSLTSTTQLKLSESECRDIFYNGVFRDPENGHKERVLKGEGMFHFSASVR